jgi:hypothetical protein
VNTEKANLTHDQQIVDKKIKKEKKRKKKKESLRLITSRMFS